MRNVRKESKLTIRRDGAKIWKRCYSGERVAVGPTRCWPSRLQHRERRKPAELPLDHFRERDCRAV